MKIIALIISMIVSTIGFAQSQISGVYSIDRFDENVRCKIYFFKSGNYYIDLSETITSDIVESFILSYGKFSLTNNEVALIDNIHNYKMLLVVDNKTLIVKQAFGFLKNKRFVFHARYTGPEFGSICTSKDALTLQEQRNIYKRVRKTLVPFTSVY